MFLQIKLKMTLHPTWFHGTSIWLIEALLLLLRRSHENLMIIIMHKRSWIWVERLTKGILCSMSILLLLLLLIVARHVGSKLLPKGTEILLVALALTWIPKWHVLLLLIPIATAARNQCMIGESEFSSTYWSTLPAGILFMATPPLVLALLPVVAPSAPPASLSLAWARSCRVRNIRAVPHCKMSRLIVLIGFPSTCRLIKCASDDNVTGSTLIELLVTSRRLRLRSRHTSSGSWVILLSRKSNIFKCGKLLHRSLGILCRKKGESASLWYRYIFLNVKPL